MIDVHQEVLEGGQRLVRPVGRVAKPIADGLLRLQREPVQKLRQVADPESEQVPGRINRKGAGSQELDEGGSGEATPAQPGVVARSSRPEQELHAGVVVCLDDQDPTV